MFHGFWFLFTLKIGNFVMDCKSFWIRESGSQRVPEYRSTRLGLWEFETV